MLFSGDEAMKKTSVLSGGERVRFMLARTVLRSHQAERRSIDYAFKKFFVTSPDLLIDFPNAVFHQFDNFRIESLSIQNPELPGEAIDDNDGRYRIPLH